MNRFRAIPEQSTFEVELQSNVHPVHARASGIYGYIECAPGPDGGLDCEAPHRAHMALWVADIDSDNELRDVEMKRRLDSRAHPTIEWVVQRVWPRNGRYLATCEVTVHGRTCSFDGDLTIAWGADRLTVEGRHVFDMRDFGLTPPRFLWLWMEPELTVRVRIVARRVVTPDPAK